MRGTKDGAVPVAHEKILGILKTITAGLGAETLLTLLQLLQQAEVARNLGSHCDVCLSSSVHKLDPLTNQKEKEVERGEDRFSWRGVTLL